jgi:hypothetical protein
VAVQLRPGEVFAGYRIEARAGSGGMGVVYRATDLALDRTVALKLVAPALAGDEIFRERLQRESRLLAMIDHPHVIPVYEAGEADGRLFVSTRWVEGPDLGGLLERTAGLDCDRALAIIGQVAAALDATHARGLVHRDVKPANILIEHRDGGDHAFLSDFGIVKEIDGADTLTSPGEWLGTLDYVSPEQIKGAPLDARADIYSLGCVLFEALTGRVPYQRDTAVAKLAAHLHEPAPSGRELCRHIPAAMDSVIARAMAKDPAQRYPTAGALARAAASATERGASGAAAPTRGAKQTAPRRPPGTPGARRRPRRRTVLTAALAGIGAAAAVAAAMVSGGSPAPARCAPDGSALHDNPLFYCDFPQDGNGRTGGTPVQAPSGARVGYLHQGKNWIECTRSGATVRLGAHRSNDWALTQSDHGARHHGWGWVNAVYVRGGDEANVFDDVPACSDRYDNQYGPPPRHGS